MKIYTTTGDKGHTSLFGGRRISKDDLRIESYGTVDELNTVIGLLGSLTLNDQVTTQLINIQNYLFVIGSNLAADPEKPGIKIPALHEDQTKGLENEIDKMELTLVPLSNFILPGGHTQNAHAHLCRTVCRRAERRVVALSQIEFVDEKIIVYLNRLSDYFFVLARYLSKLNDQEELFWKP